MVLHHRGTLYLESDRRGCAQIQSGHTKPSAKRWRSARSRSRSWAGLSACRLPHHFPSLHSPLIRFERFTQLVCCWWWWCCWCRATAEEAGRALWSAAMLSATGKPLRIPQPAAADATTGRSNDTSRRDSGGDSAKSEETKKRRKISKNWPQQPGPEGKESEATQLGATPGLPKKRKVSKNDLAARAAATTVATGISATAAG